MNNNTDITLTTSAEHHEQTLELIKQATRSILIFCHDLTNRIYNHPDIAMALSQFITTNSANRTVKILVQDVNSIISSDHKILEIQRRLSSSISIHKIARQHENHIASYILTDGKHYINRKDYTLFDGHLVKNPNKAKELLNLFNECWSQSETPPEIKRLYI